MTVAMHWVQSQMPLQMQAQSQTLHSKKANWLENVRLMKCKMTTTKFRAPLQTARKHSVYPPSCPKSAVTRRVVWPEDLHGVIP